LDNPETVWFRTARPVLPPAARAPAALDADPDVEAADEAAAGGYARGARVLSVGIAATGVFTFAYFAVASHVLGDNDYGAISTLWSILFVTISVIYRPVEQLLSRTIARRRAVGLSPGGELRAPAAIQLAFAAAFLVVAFAARGPITDVLRGSSTLFWVLVAATLAYAASYFARGYLAGHQWFGLYGGLVLFESVSRFCFPLAVAIGIASGQAAVALGIAAAPFASLLVVPWALSRHAARASAAGARRDSTSTREGADFAMSVAAIQLSEQALLNAAVLLVGHGKPAAIVFSAFLITRAPLQLFQSVQTSLLPHLAGLEATEGAAAFARAVRVTLLAIAAFAGAVALGLLVLGPWVMGIVFDVGVRYGRVGLAVIALGMGFHLAAGTLNQAALARGRARAAATAWLASAGLFVVWMVVAAVGDALVRAEVGYAGATALLCGLLYVLERPRRPGR
jgi:O-antigen/teichoic acid export membrane protein